MLDASCPDESTSQHFDIQKSHGPVHAAEWIIFVVLDELQIDNDGRLTLEAFPQRRLKKREASIARCAYTTASNLHENVISKAIMRGNVFYGLCLAKVDAVREVLCRHPVNGKECRAFCVLDIVLPGDADDHGVISFSESISATLDALKPGEIGRVREVMRTALAEVFGPICKLHDPTCFKLSVPSLVDDITVVGIEGRHDL